jgi:hypothetical protein
MRRAARWLAAGLLFGAVVYLVYGYTGTWNHQSVSTTTLYWAGIFYTQTALPLVAVCLLTAVGMGVTCLLEWWLRKGERWIPVSAVLFAVVATSVGVFAVFPAMFVRLYHRDSDYLHGHVYELALRTAFDGDNLYILYECDSLGAICTSRAISNADTNPLSQSAVLRADDAIAIEVDGEIVSTYPVQ